MACSGYEARVQVMPMKKLLGLAVAAGGIAWYTTLNQQQAPPPKHAVSAASPRS